MTLLDCLRLLPLRCGLDEITAIIFVVMPNPRHGVRQSVFVSSLRHKIKEVISADQDVESSRIGGIGVKDLAVSVPEEDARTGPFLAGELRHRVVVIRRFQSPRSAAVAET